MVVPAGTQAVCGLTVTLTAAGPTVIVAVADRAGSATLVAVTVTVCGEAIDPDAGAE